MKVFLDNFPVYHMNPTLLEPKFSLRRNTGGDNPDTEAVISFTGDLNFSGKDYDYIYKILVTDPKAITNFIVLKFIDDCCNNKEYIFVIKPESIKWCEGFCEISANALEYSVDSAAYACFYNTMIYDNHNGFQNKQHPRVAYCLEFRPSILQDLMIIFAILTFTITFLTLDLLLPVILLLVGSINLVIKAVNALGGSLKEITIGGYSDPMGIFNWFKGVIKDANALVIGCGYNHPSPLIRDYINNVCSKCNVSFQSSILNDANSDYFNAVYFNAPVHKGQNKAAFGGFNKTLINYMMINAPIHNGKTFLDELIQGFNARWDIHNGVLRFERHDFFAKQKPFVDLTTYDKSKIISVCYEWTKKPRPSYANIGYSKDGIDWVGDEAVERWSDIVEWNPNQSALQKGSFTRTFPWGAARFRGDNLDRDVFNDYTWAPFGFGTAIKNNTDVLLMNNGTCLLPKVLILRKGYDWQHALIENGYATFADTVDGWRENIYPNQPYNYPMWVREGLKNNLYDRFWSIENPNNIAWKGRDFTATIEWDCATLAGADIDGTVMTSQGLAKVESIDLDFSNSEMVIKGTL